MRERVAAATVACACEELTLSVRSSMERLQQLSSEIESDSPAQQPTSDFEAMPATPVAPARAATHFSPEGGAGDDAEVSFGDGASPSFPRCLAAMRLWRRTAHLQTRLEGTKAPRCYPALRTRYTTRRRARGPRQTAGGPSLAGRASRRSANRHRSDASAARCCSLCHPRGSRRDERPRTCLSLLFLVHMSPATRENFLDLAEMPERPENFRV